MRRFGFFLSKFVLIRPRRLDPACLTHKSRGNERMAAWLSCGLTRINMIESLRSPYDARLPKPPAYGESLATHALLSEPVMRKFFALRSPAGKFKLPSPSGTESMVTTWRLPNFQLAYKSPDPAATRASDKTMLNPTNKRSAPERRELTDSSDMTAPP